MENPETRRKRYLFGISGSLLFVYLGWWLYYSSHTQTLLPPNVVEIIGIVAMAFFGIATIIGIKKYFSE